MIVAIAILTFLLGIIVGALVLYIWHRKQIRWMFKRHDETTKKLREMIKADEIFVESMWPEKSPQIVMNSSVADYLREKYLSTEFNSDCKDESDIL